VGGITGGVGRQDTVGNLQGGLSSTGGLERKGSQKRGVQVKNIRGIQCNPDREKLRKQRKEVEGDRFRAGKDMGEPI